MQSRRSKLEQSAIIHQLPEIVSVEESKKPLIITREGEKADLPPEDSSEVRLLYPDHVRMCVSTGPDESDEEEGDGESEDEDDSEDDEPMAEEEDIEESSDEEETKKRPVKAGKKKEKKKSGKKEKSKKDKQEKKKKKPKEQENSTESSEEEQSMGEDEDEDEYQEDEDLGEEWIVLYHSVSNDHTKHMVGVPEPYALKFTMDHKEALFQIIDKAPEYVLVSSLPLSEAKRIKMVTSLWAEGLLEVKQQ